MQHDDDVGASPQRLHVAGLLIAPVSPVPLVLDDMDGQIVGNADRVVLGLVVHDDQVVGDRPIDLRNRLADGLRGVVCRHHDADPLSRDHALSRVAGAAAAVPRRPEHSHQ